MSAVPAVLRALYEGERAMERKLLETAARDAAEHEVHHVAVDLARWSHEHAERLAEAAEPYGLRLSRSAEEPPGPEDRGERAARALADTRSGLDLLNDLRELHLAATGNSLDWEMLAQAAQADKDSSLLDLATACHPQTLRQMRWTNTMIKTLSPQLLSKAGAASREA
ncbi:MULTISPECIES: hypothetical protein [unclassified Streptomyces]|uniref:hypothetical protein n=1 Tax=unclassified Streptomyces TaxID=2593676 RepID=UPI000747E983|nr:MULTISPECIES: hypothetical protein [unclassified Streptomyces]KUL69082.1 hypothetical protein ADL34_31800 [Streptomyces sp. NRRL WC-3605]KUL80194.1 hypothetical protein ADL33_02940 [Streptomyces sp. NRRL WC-3604]